VLLALAVPVWLYFGALLALAGLVIGVMLAGGGLAFAAAYAVARALRIPDPSTFADRAMPFALVAIGAVVVVVLLALD